MTGTTSRPNILVIMTDQHSKHVLGAYGNEIVRTPNIDALSERGMRFTNAYCPSPLCVPSRMSFMTARWPSNNRVWTNTHILPSTVPTWAHALGASGYETTLIGRMHFEGPDQRHGFERRPVGEYFAMYPGAGTFGAPVFRATDMGSTGLGRKAVEHSGYGRNSYQAIDELVTGAAVEYLKEKAAGGDGRPFAAVVGYVLPHCPFFAPKDLFDYYYERVDVPEPTPDELDLQPEAIRRLKRHQSIDVPFSRERIRIARAAYFGMCELIDRFIGRVLEALDAAGLTDDTLVVYTSDHGESAGEHGCWWKAQYYESSVGVPLIVSQPGTIPSGSTNNTISNLADIGPTLIDVAGAECLPAGDGQSLWQTLSTGTEEVRDTFSELYLHPVSYPPSRMIRSGPWKLWAYHDDTPPALFNLTKDPDELNDLGGAPEHADIRRELLDRLYSGWDPECVLTNSEELDRDHRLIAQWGRAVRLRHADQETVPDCEDMTIL